MTTGREHFEALRQIATDVNYYRDGGPGDLVSAVRSYCASHELVAVDSGDVLSVGLTGAPGEFATFRDNCRIMRVVLRG